MEYQRNALISKLESSRKKRKVLSPGKVKRSNETELLRKKVSELQTELEVRKKTTLTLADHSELPLSEARDR